MHIVKLGAEWSLEKIPVTVFGEAGALISHFSNIKSGKANSGASYPFSFVDTPDYPKSTGFIVTLGVKVFP
jgi:hypothetical protein